MTNDFREISLKETIIGNPRVPITRERESEKLLKNYRWGAQKLGGIIGKGDVDKINRT